MRKTLICGVCLCLLLAGSALFAQATGGAATTGTTTGTTGTTTGTGHGHGKGMSHHGHTAAGTVVSVEAACASFVVKPKKGDNWTFTTDAKTTYWKGKDKATCDDLKADEHVYVSYHMDGDKHVANKVKIGAAKASKASKSKTTGTTG